MHIDVFFGHIWMYPPFDVMMRMKNF
uniref:Uncharacterized protein n=1 Tax=Rhizophora mucronata TaxID=61149 RepID=A0A2P2PCG7_RHIMU